jgi:hypothetical protein
MTILHGRARSSALVIGPNTRSSAGAWAMSK